MNTISRKDIWRIIDVNFNRSREGLRVCEEIARFILNSAAITKEVKAVRHRISNIAESLPAGRLSCLRARDSNADVGRCSGSHSEMRRTDCQDIFFANMERAKESIRVLEEFFKLVDKRISAKFSSLRFRTYDIEKKMLANLK